MLTAPKTNKLLVGPVFVRVLVVGAGVAGWLVVGVVVC
jgi:hypothetical protein